MKFNLQGQKRETFADGRKRGAHEQLGEEHIAFKIQRATKCVHFLLRGFQCKNMYMYHNTTDRQTDNGKHNNASVWVRNYSFKITK